MKSANRARSEVALPDAFGKGVFIRFTIDAMERLEGEFGENFVEVIVDGTANARASVFKKVLQNALVGDVEIDYECLQQCMSETRACILDALFLTIHGRTVAEQMEKEEADKLAGIERQLEKMGQDPQMASALSLLGSLQQFVGPGTEPGSDLTRSDATPQEK